MAERTSARRRGQVRHTAIVTAFRLTPREQQAATLLARGFGTTRVAAELGVSTDYAELLVGLTREKLAVARD